jgi:tRNA (guanine-N7-)-methyltransferase
MTVRRASRLPLAALQPLLLEAPPPRRPLSAAIVAEPFDWRAVFGNDQPIEMEIGFGKGLFLVSASQAQPSVNFVGVEIERKYVLATATRLVKHNISSVRLVASDARWFLAAKVAEASVQAIHIYFPDPWWKNRHRKRKLMTEDFVNLCWRALAPAGRLHFATDVEDYFTETQALIERLALWQLAERPEARTPAHDLDYLTHFERKYRQEGRAIYRAVYGK